MGILKDSLSKGKNRLYIKSMIEIHKQQLEKKPMPSRAGYYFHGYHEGCIQDLEHLLRDIL